MKIKSHRGIYEIHFNENLSNILADDNSFFIIDKKVFNLYPSIQKCKNYFLIEPTEENKSLETCTYLIDKLLSNNIKKNHRLVAIGGGIIQDIVCFIASNLYRGLHWYFIPTTLLAQADSCIGSKSSINYNNYKNLLGGFYPPKKIFCNFNFLKTLSVNDIKSGLGEILHFLFIGKSKLLNTFNFDYNNLINLDTTINKYIKECLAIKKVTIENDEFDLSTRQINNFGHTFGHAIESATEYKIQHGQAVTIGMSIANYISYNLNYIDKQTYDKNNTIINCNKPAYSLSRHEKHLFFKALKRDKKNINNSIVCILQRCNIFEIITFDKPDYIINIINNYFIEND